MKLESRLKDEQEWCKTQMQDKTTGIVLRGVFWCKVGTRAPGWAWAQGLEVGPSYSLRVRLDRLGYCSVDRTPECSNIIPISG